MSIKEFIVYEVDGKRFDQEIDAQYYKHLCQRISKIMSLLKPRTKEVEDNLAYIEHDKKNLNIAFSRFMGVCGEVIPLFKEGFAQVGVGERHISHAGYIIGNYSSDFPIISKTFSRFSCINFETGYEFQQPYYASHIQEAFEDIERKKEYLRKNGSI